MTDLPMARLRGRGPEGGRLTAQPRDCRPLLGVWRGYDERGTGIVRVEIAERDRQLVVLFLRADGFGGNVVGSAFTAGVDEQVAVGFLARYRSAGVHLALAAYLNKRLLVVDCYYSYVDESGRANRFQRDHFYNLTPVDGSPL